MSEPPIDYTPEEWVRAYVEAIRNKETTHNTRRGIMKPRYVILIIGIIGIVTGLNMMLGPARIIGSPKGVHFEMTGITDEYADGVVGGLDMSGVLTDVASRRVANDHWQFRGKYRR